MVVPKFSSLPAPTLSILGFTLRPGCFTARHFQSERMAKFCASGGKAIANLFYT
jgi:hypothetical protein